MISLICASVGSFESDLGGQCKYSAGSKRGRLATQYRKRMPYLRKFAVSFLSNSKIYRKFSHMSNLSNSNGDREKSSAAVAEIEKVWSLLCDDWQRLRAIAPGDIEFDLSQPLERQLTRGVIHRAQCIIPGARKHADQLSFSPYEVEDINDMAQAKLPEFREIDTYRNELIAEQRSRRGR